MYWEHGQQGVFDSGAYVTLAGSIGQTAPGGDQGGGEISGDSRRASVSVSVPLKRSRDLSVWLDSSAAYISLAQDDLGNLLRVETHKWAVVTSEGQIANGLQTLYQFRSIRTRINVPQPKMGRRKTLKNGNNHLSR